MVVFCTWKIIRMCVYMCGYIYAHMCVHLCGEQSSMLGVILSHSSPCFLRWRDSCSLNLELADLARLYGQEVPEIHLSPPTRARIAAFTWHFKCGHAQSLMLAWQALCQWSHLLRLKLMFTRVYRVNASWYFFLLISWVRTVLLALHVQTMVPRIVLSALKVRIGILAT